MARLVGRGRIRVEVNAAVVVLSGRGYVDRSIVGLLRLLQLSSVLVAGGRRFLCATTFEEKEDGQTDEDEREHGTADDHANDPRLKCST